MYRLVFENLPTPRPPLTGLTDRLLIGRDPSCQLRLIEPGVSDRHAAIERRADGWYICDLASVNGVRVNDRPVTEQRLASGDRIEIGPVRLRFEIDHTAGQPRRWSPLQLFAAIIIGTTLAVQLGVILWVLLQPRSRHMRVHAAVKLEEPTSPPSAPSPVLSTTPPLALATAPSPPRSVSAPEPVVLNRKIRIERLTADGPTLHILARAQVGERRLDRELVAVTAEWFVVDEAGRTVSAGPPIPVEIPAWENFEARTLTVRVTSPPPRLAGFVVRTYYGGELQDLAATPPALLTLVSGGRGPLIPPVKE